MTDVMQLKALCVCLCVCVCRSMLVRVCMCMCMFLCVCFRVCICVYLFVWCLSLCLCVYTCMCVILMLFCMCVPVLNVRMYVILCLFVCVFVWLTTGPRLLLHGHRSEASCGIQTSGWKRSAALVKSGLPLYGFLTKPAIKKRPCLSLDHGHSGPEMTKKHLQKNKNVNCWPNHPAKRWGM